MCKKTTYKCDRTGCNYTQTKDKNNIPIDLNPYPRDFKKVRINKKTYHLCPDCYTNLSKQNEAFIHGEN